LILLFERLQFFFGTHAATLLALRSTRKSLGLLSERT
jgi:hypothetical protein